MIRRKFIKKTGILTTGSLLALQYKSKVMASILEGRSNYGIQLYTVRDDMSQDPVGTLRKLSSIGYKDVECAGYRKGKFYGMSPKDFKKVLDDLGLIMNSGHTNTGDMMNRWESVCEDAAFMGQKHLVGAWLSEAERSSIDKYKKLSELFNKCGEKAREYGIGFAFHNHDFEFLEIDGVVPYDVMLAETDPTVANFELDLYWIIKAGKNPLEYFQKHKGRFPLWHVKDMEDSDDQFFTEVGNGVIDWLPIFEKEQESGMKYFYVEQDICRNHKPLESARISIDYLKSIEV